MNRGRILILGMASRIPVAGVVWQTLHYLEGFRRLGYDVYYVEQHGRTPTMLMRSKDDNGTERAVTFLHSWLDRFGFQGRWLFQARYDNNQCYGFEESKLKDLFRSADLIINLHGGTMPLPDHYETHKLLFLETDPVEVQIELHRADQTTIDFLAPHFAFFTFGENYGQPDCKLPVSDRFHFKPTRQPVIMDFWAPKSNGVRPRFTTVGNWRQNWRTVQLNGETYSWSKHHEFLKFIDLPKRTSHVIELALGNLTEDDRRMLESYGWNVRAATDFSMDVDAYRDYIAGSTGEFTVAKDQNVRLRTGWFSDRSATYLASGRPVITQETGFSNIFPVGEGLFAFSTMEEAVEAIEYITADYERQSRAAISLAREYFAHDVVLGKLLRDIGMQ